VLLVAVVPTGRPASADTISSERAQAAQVNAELQADQSKLDALAQQFEEAQQQLSSIQSQIGQIQASIAADQAHMSADQSALRNQALAAYETGASDSGLGTVFGQNGEQAAVTQEYTNLATGSMTTALDNLRLAQDRLSDEQAQLQVGEAQQQATVDQIAAAQSAAQATTASEQATLHSLNGEIASLVAGEEAADRPDLGGSGANPPPDGAAGVAIEAAESQIGVPYQWGAEDPGHGFDCSGLTQWSYRQAGVSLPRTAEDQYEATTRVPLGDMEPGDLVFWGSGGTATHVGIYVGNGDIVDAPSTGQDVQIQPIWSDGLMGAGRP